MVKHIGARVIKILPFGVILAIATPVMARTIELKLFPVNGPFTGCPSSVIAYETPQPYREGSYATDGMLQLRSIATDVSLFKVDPFTVTWVGTLKPQFRNCQATASMWVVDGQAHKGKFSYVRLQLLDGKAYAILDMTGMPDANNFTTVITYKGIRDGNPRWTWGGTD